MRTAWVTALLVVALAACGGKRSRPAAEEAPSAWVPAFSGYALHPPPAPAPSVWLDRVPVPATLIELPIVTRADAPVPADFLVQTVHRAGDTAIAVASGVAADGPAVVVFEVETGRVRWSDARYCNGPVVHASAAAVVCAGGRGLAALSLANGQPIWTSPYLLRAAHDGVALLLESAAGHRARVVDLETGASLLAFSAEPEVPLADAKVLCRRDQGFELFGWSELGEFWLTRLESASPSAVALRWAVSLPASPAQVELCRSPLLLAVPRAREVEQTLYALDPEFGQPLGAAREIFGFWAAGADRVVVSDADGLHPLSRGLAPVAEAGPDVPSAGWLGAWLAADGDRQLTRAPGGAVAIVDDDGRAAWLPGPLEHAGALLIGDRIVSGMWASPRVSNANPPRLYRLVGAPTVAPPARQPPTPTLVTAPPLSPAAAAADLAGLGDRGLLAEAAEVGRHRVDQIVLGEGAVAMATYETRPGPDSGAGVSLFDLAQQAFVFHAANVCGRNGTVVGLAVTRELVICGARRHHPQYGEVVALARADGKVAWRREFAAVDRIDAVADTVLVTSGARARYLAAATGATRYEIDDVGGSEPRATLLAHDTVALAISVEGDRLVARVPAAGGLPLWSVGVGGLVSSLSRAGAAALLTTADGRALVVSQAAPSAPPTARVLAGRSYAWSAPGGGALVVDGGISVDGWASAQVQRAGGEVIGRMPPANQAPYLFGPRADGAPLVAVSGSPGVGRLVALAADGQVRASVTLPQRATKAGAFGVRIAGVDHVGVVLQAPLAVVLVPLQEIAQAP